MKIEDIIHLQPLISADIRRTKKFNLTVFSAYKLAKTKCYISAKKMQNI